MIKVGDMALSQEPDKSPLPDENTERERRQESVNMAGILQGLQATLEQLAKNSERLTEDILLRSDDEETEDKSEKDDHTSGNTLDIASTLRLYLTRATTTPTTIRPLSKSLTQGLRVHW